jgi:hypothetical protein
VNLFPNPEDVSLLAERWRTFYETWRRTSCGSRWAWAITSIMARRVAPAFTCWPRIPGLALPYAADAVGQATQIRAALASSGTRLVRCTEDITDVFEEKLRAASVYASQFKLSYIEPRLRGLAEREGGAAGKFGEAYHRIEGEPGLPREGFSLGTGEAPDRDPSAHVEADQAPPSDGDRAAVGRFGEVEY